MSEITIGFTAFVAVVFIAIYAFLKMIGGRPNGRIFKRFVAPTFLGLFIVVCAFVVHGFHWLYLLGIPLYIGEAYVDGYGYNGSSELIAFLRRLISATLFCSVALIYALPSHRMLFFYIQLAIGVIFEMATVDQNKTGAPVEEFLIQFLRAVLIPFMV